MKAIIFDFDGVIADTTEYGKQIVRKVGHDITDEQFKAHHDGNVFEKPAIAFTEESANAYFDEYFKEVHQNKPFVTVTELKHLREKYDLFIISSNNDKAIEKYLSHHELEYFSEVLGKYFHKCKVEKFKYLFDKYDLQPEECIFITDTLGDIRDGHKANVKTIAVDFGFHESERLEKGNPFKIVSSFQEVIEIIEKS